MYWTPALKAKNLIVSEVTSVVDASWIVDSVAEGRKMVLSPKYVKYLTSQMRTEVGKVIDPYGDSFTEDATFESLKMVTNIILDGIPVFVDYLM
jgi:hypothetical protein